VAADVHQGLAIENASVVTMLLTLQFVRPLHRERVMRRIYEGLEPNGCLLLVEKLTGASTVLNRLFINHYYEFKRRNGYSETEIAQKREALENVLIPYRLEENVQLLEDTGFSAVECFFRWYNFCGIIAVK
jgi:tRNA (cmo5U34)-methyltransferase